MTPVCPDPRCAELNSDDAVDCHACGKALVPGRRRERPKTWSELTFEAGRRRTKRGEGLTPLPLVDTSMGDVSSPPPNPTPKGNG